MIPFSDYQGVIEHAKSLGEGISLGYFADMKKGGIIRHAIHVFNLHRVGVLHLCEQNAARARYLYEHSSAEQNITKAKGVRTDESTGLLSKEVVLSGVAAQLAPQQAQHPKLTAYYLS